MSARVTPAPLLRRRILVFDAGLELGDRLAQAFEPLGFEIATAGNEEALAVVRDYRPDVVFVTVDAGDRSGFALCNQLKRTADHELPVVLVSRAVPRKQLAGHRRLRGRADVYLERAVDDRALIDAVARLVDLGVAPPPAGDVIDLFSEVDRDTSVDVEALADDEPESDDAVRARQVTAREDDFASASDDDDDDAPEVDAAGEIEPPQPEPLPDPPGGSAELAALRVDNALLRAQLEEARAFNAEAALAREAEFVELRRCVTELSRDHAELHAASVADRERLIERERTVASLTATTEQQSAHIEALERDLVSANVSLAELERDADQTRRALDKLRGDHTALIAELQTARADAETAREAADETERAADEHTARMRADHADELDALAAEREAERAELQRVHAEQLAALCTSADQHIERLLQEHADAIAKLEAEWLERVETAERAGAAALSAQHLMMCRSLRP